MTKKSLASQTLALIRRHAVTTSLAHHVHPARRAFYLIERNFL
ncbi:hypothetical protein [Anaerocolumna xylanovorans]|nr:hypothetical protein [Anaerocolumna xylanovorans]